jgi:predicted 2-oxoglutarate/Fe(II)-dependent dioxygenase YbiX
LLDENVCAEFVARIAPLTCWQGARSYTPDDRTSYVDLNARRHWTLAPTLAPAAFAPVLQTLEEKFARYTDPAREPNLVLAQFVANRYEAGDFFQIHADALPAHNPERRYSLVLYLSDDFGGGGTIFPTIDRTYKPSAGQGLVFPSHYLHGADPVESGTKYVIVGFLCDKAQLANGAVPSPGGATP